MRSLALFLYLVISWVKAQNARGPQHQDHSGHGWDIRLAVPGEPGNDYPTLGAIPRTTFSCAGREPGYYADLETNCQVFRVCTVGSTYGFQSFLCPNGTLFNQAVFVCDWWMNVDCQNSQKFFTNNDQKFENLRLGPQLMKDIKKMLTHPMRNPLDKSAMKSNLIVMQDYKPPSGQIFPNGALLAGPERPPNNVYVPAKLLNQFSQNNLNDITFSASTPEPTYLSGKLSINPLLSQSNSEAFPRQRQNGQYIQSRIQPTQTLQSGNLISNGHAGRYVQNAGLNINGYAQLPRPTQNTFSQTQPSMTDTSLSRNIQRGPSKQRAQYTEQRKLSQPNGRQINFGASLKPQNQNYINQDKPTTSSSVFPQFSNLVDNPAGKELKQNLVSTIEDVSSTVPTKATTYTARVEQSTKALKTKPRLTAKTWIVKPMKSARLIVSPTPYSYPSPTQTPNGRFIDDTTPYAYDGPTSLSTEKIISAESDTESEEPYVYTKPIPLPKQFSTAVTARLLVAPTSSTIRSTFSGRLNLPPSPTPVINARANLTPSSFRTNDRFYLPPPGNLTPLSRQYLPPDIQRVYYGSAQLKAIPTMSSPTYVSFTPNSNKPTASPSKSNFNNLTFTDVLTKEKLDITVNDIVKDTNNILRTASPDQYRGEFDSIDYIENDILPTRTTTDSGENLTSQSPLKSIVSAKSSRLVATPSPNLQPPKVNIVNLNTNRISQLPFLKEPSLPNTIERTVSIKITIPERIAAYFFKNNSESDFDKLEILNTDSSNYLVLSNNLLTKNNGFNFIPIAKLNDNKNRNISNSQALVYSFLADSINVAKEYNNIATQEVLSSTSTPATSQFQNVNGEDLSQITNKISQLTSSQFSSNNFNKLGNQANIISSQTTSTNPTTKFSSNAIYTQEQNQPRQVQSAQYNIIPSQQTQQLYSSRLQTADNTENNLSNEIYSGQLYQRPVPYVTDHIYNRPISAELLSNHQSTQMNQQSGNLINAPSNFQQNPTFEVVKAKTISLNPVNMHLEPPSAPTPFTSQETLNNLLKSDSGISAHLQDNIIGTIAHPSDANKRVTYKKNQSYYLYTKLEDDTMEQNVPTRTQSNNVQQNAKLTQGNAQNHLSFQLVPSVSYELKDEKEQENILNTFRIDEFGAPRDVITTNNAGENTIERKDIEVSADVDLSTQQQALNKQMEKYRINTLYDEPSSFSAPQSSADSLETLEARQVAQNNNYNSRLEDLDNNSNGYPKERPAREFTF